MASRKSLRHLSAGPAAALLALLIGSQSAAAATFIVTSLADGVDGSPGNGVCATATSACTLRAAIQEANALPGPDTIIIPAGIVVLTIPGEDDTAVSGDLDITSTMTISGSGYASTSISGTAFISPDRIFHVLTATNVTIKGVTIASGRRASVSSPSGDGAGLLAQASSVTLDGVRFYTNTAGSRGGAILNLGGALTLTNSILDTNEAKSLSGGGVFNVAGALTVINSTVVNNRAADSAGGIGSTGVATTYIGLSEITGNRSTYGGGAWSFGGRTVIDDSSFSNNRAFQGGGLYSTASSQVTMTASTLDSNRAVDGGGLHVINSAALMLDGATIINNSASGLGGGMRVAISSTLTSIGGMVDGNVAGRGGGLYGGNATQLRIIDGLFSNNAATATVSGNGGGIHVDSGASLAITGTTLQFNRADGAGGGAWTYLTPLYITRSVVYSNSASGGGGLAVEEANAEVFNTTIQQNRAITLSSGGIYANALLMKDSAVLSNTAAATTGGVGLGPNLADIRNSQIRGNRATTSTGGLYCSECVLRISGSTVAANMAGSVGGIYVNSADTRIVDSFVTSNTALSGRSGAIEFTFGDVWLTRTTFMSNTAAGDGGAIWGDVNTILRDAQGIFTANRSTGGNGGALHNGGVTLLTDTALTGNRATSGTGGAVWNGENALSALRVLVDRNTASNAGGVYAGDSLWVQSIITGNVATNNAGGLGAGLGLRLEQTTVANNQASSGGGVVVGEADGQFVNSTVSGNRAYNDGGGILANNGATIIRLVNATVANNTADLLNIGAGTGGGVFIQAPGGTINAKNSIVARNSGGSAPDCSGALVSQNYNLIEVTTGCSITGVTANDITGANPQLGPLSGNGGPTPTQPLLHASPAIDAANPAGCTWPNGSTLYVDQRGRPRPLDGNGDGVARCDMGAYEAGTIVYIPATRRDAGSDW